MDLLSAKEKEVANGTAFGAVNYEFAFNNIDYSDCILRIKAFSSSASTLDGERALNAALDSFSEKDLAGCSEANAFAESLKTPPIDGEVNTDIFSFGSSNGNGKGRNICCNRLEEPEISSVSTLHVNSLLLSAHSPFFRKLYTNGMQESKQKEATLCVNASEEAAVMDLLRYIYSGRVQANTGKELLSVIEVAEKFGAVYCIQYCVRLLLIAPMTMTLALMCMRLPTTVIQNEAVQPLTREATSILIDHFKDFKRRNLEALTLPLEGVKAVLASDEIEVDSEDEIYDFIIAWAREHYSNIEERTRVLTSSLVQLVRFPMMTIGKLRDMQYERNDEHTLVSQFVSEAFVYKAELLHRQKKMAKEEVQTRRYINRAYKRIPVKVIEFEKPYRHFILYLTIKKKDFLALTVSGELVSESIDLERGIFYLLCQRVGGAVHQEMFRLDARLQSSVSLPFKIECKFAARSKAMRLDFYHLHATAHTYKVGECGMGLTDPFKTYWSSFVAETSPYFVDDALSLRVEIVYT